MLVESLSGIFFFFWRIFKIFRKFWIFLGRNIDQIKIKWMDTIINKKWKKYIYSINKN